MLYLRIERDEDQAVELTVGSRVTRFGRDADNDVVLDDYAASRHHAELICMDGLFELRDLGSRNGTVVHRRACDATEVTLCRADGAVRLAVGDAFTIGDARIVLAETIHDGELESATRAPRIAPVDGLETLDISGRHAVALIDLLARFARALTDTDGGSLTASLERLRAFFGARWVCLVGDARTVCVGVVDGPSALPVVDLPAYAARWTDDVAGSPLLSANVGGGTRLQVGYTRGTARPAVEDLRAFEVAAAIAGQFARLQGTCEALVRSNRTLASDARAWQRAARSGQPSEQIIAASAAMRRVVEEATRAASGDVAVLLTGETGVGKEVVARFIHTSSARRDRHFVAVNCAALGDELFDSELFGHRRGAFTGAATDKLGLFELADGGVLFLDEIGELSGVGQAKLLRALEDGSFRRIGDERERCADVRVIAATNRDLDAAIEAGRFRRDLLYRLAVFRIAIPPLRERTADLLPLVDELLARHAHRAGSSPAQLDVDASRALHGWHWPGNVRELRNVVERAALIADGPIVRAEHLQFGTAPAERDELDTLFDLARDDAFDAFARLYFERLLSACDWNVARAARAAGVTRRNLYQVIERHGLKRPPAVRDCDAE